MLNATITELKDLFNLTRYFTINKVEKKNKTGTQICGLLIESVHLHELSEGIYLISVIKTKTLKINFR